MKSTIVIIAALLFAAPLSVSAHQPQIVVTELIAVLNPEVSKAYYGKLKGEPHVYIISETQPFNLYVNVLQPDVAEAKKDVSVVVLDPAKPDEPLVTLESSGPWTPFFEFFAQDAYWKGEEFEREVPAGTYEIRVWSSNNDSPYVLAIGKKERFGPASLIDAYTTIPKLKVDFFHQPALDAYFTPILGGPLALLMFLAALAFVTYLRWRAMQPPQ